MHLEHVPRSDIAELNIPTGAPRRYTFDAQVPRVTERRSISATPRRITKAAAAVAAQAGTT